MRTDFGLTPRAPRLADWTSAVGWIVWGAGAVAFPFLVMGPWAVHFDRLPARLVSFTLLSLVGAAGLAARSARRNLGVSLVATILVYGLAYKLVSFIPDVSAFPFSLGWSEASRYYYASLFFSERLYGVALPPSILHPTRYLLQSAPFLIPDLPLWAHRLWQVMLWVAASGLASWLLARRVNLSPGTVKSPAGRVALWALFAFLFFFQGPVYYHLLVVVILVAWLAEANRPWRTLAIVLAASAWAGLSRLNWLPVPGLLAAGLYLLETPLFQARALRPSAGRLLRYLLPPAAWVGIGSATALAAQRAYEIFSGNPPELFGSALESALLWYRLWPNPTYPLGILPASLLVSLPLALIAAWHLWPHWRRYHGLRLAGLAAILAVLWAGGIVVSLKIGGGSNLHNLDAYLVLFLVIGGAVGLGRMRPEGGAEPLLLTARLPGWLAALALIYPLALTVAAGGPPRPADPAQTTAVIQSIQSAVDRAEGEVLFIRERQLLTFGLVQGVALVPDYELVFLMEMAMAGNRLYLDRFEGDLRAQRFALIVSEPLLIQYQGRSHQFGEENDAWVARVSEPVLCYYELDQKLDFGLALYTPRQSSCR